MTTDRFRLQFMDNLRYFSVWCVVVFHTSVGYTGLPEYYVETEIDRQLLVVRHGVVIFMLPLLFVLAGYFTLPSLRQRGEAAFLRQRLGRLGVPFLVGILLLGPLMPYLGYYAQSFKGLSSASYWEFWTHYIASGFAAWSLPIVFTTHPDFHHQHFYFLSFLIEILVVFVIGRALWKRWWPSHGMAVGADARPNFTMAFLAVAVTVPVLHFLTSRWPGTARVFLFFLYFSLSDLLLFGAAFALGVYAYGKHWFVDGRHPGWPVLVTLGVVLVLFHQGSSLLHAHRQEVPPGLLLLEHGLADSFITWFIIAVLLALGVFVLNGTSRFHSEMAASSYDIYLLQYPVILALRLPLITWEAPAWVKFVVVVPLTVAVCWAISRSLIRPRPLTALTVLVCLHVLLCVFGVPRWGDSHLLLDRRDALLSVVPRPEGGTRVAMERPGILAPLSRDKPAASIAWSNGDLYMGHNQGGLFVRHDDGGLQTLIGDAPIGDLVSRADGTLLAVAIRTGEILQWDPDSRERGTLVDGGAVAGTPLYLAPAVDGALYFTTVADRGSGALFVSRPDGRVARLALADDIREPRGVAFDDDRGLLYLNDGQGTGLWVTQIGADGEPGPWSRLGELFRADRRYGERRQRPVPSSAEGMTIDAAGNVYVATDPGVQVFSPSGRLLGLVSFPELLSRSYRPPRPMNLAFGGNDGATLYVTCADLVYAVATIAAAGARSGGDANREGPERRVRAPAGGHRDTVAATAGMARD